MEPAFEKLLALLADAGVKFIVVGGVAVTLNGYVRLTEGVGILLEASPDNNRPFLETMCGYGEGFARELSSDDFTDEEGAIRIVEETEQCQVDVFTRMSGQHYADLLTDAETLRTSQHEIRYASRAALIRLKERSVREKDRLDVTALRRLENSPR
jgi:predicted nucleotidyltransferase